MRKRIGALGAVLALMGAGCAAPESTVLNASDDVSTHAAAAPAGWPVSIDPSAVTSVSILVDWPGYSSITDLAKASVAVVSVEVVRSESQLEYPDFDSEVPMTNPYAGTDRSPSATELRDMATPATFHHVRVVWVGAGDLRPGDDIVIMESGGVMDGVAYEVGDFPKLSQDQLLFLNVTPNGNYETVGGGQGRFVPDGMGGFVSVTSPDLRVDASGLTDLPSLLGP